MKSKRLEEWGTVYVFTKYPGKSIHNNVEAQPHATSVSLVRYWTWRYMIILLIMLMGIGLFGMYWIRTSTVEQQFQLLEARSAMMSDSFGKMDDFLQATTTSPANSIEKIPTAPKTSENIPLQESVPSIPSELVPSIPDGYQFQLFNVSGEMIYLFSNAYTEEGVYLNSPPRQNEVLSGEKIRDKVDTQSGKWLRVGVPFYKNNQISGTLYMTAQYNEGRLPQIYGLIVVTVGLISLCGWAVVFVLSRSLTRPLIQLASAAKQLSSGNYQPYLPDPSLVRESEISELIQAFHEMTGRLDQLERMRTDLLAGVSHELRTPITSIRGMLQAIQEGVVTGSKANEFINIGLNEAKRMHVMVNDLLNFSSMESGVIHPEKSQVLLQPLLEEIIQQFHTIQTSPSVQVELDMLSSNSVCICDRSHLKQVVLNLLSNSAAAAATIIKITVRTTESMLTIDISDNGKGIAPDEVPYIFERYYRGNSRRKKKQGLGLGLSICRLLAQANGGTIELLQTASTGTVFRLSFPRESH
ncbi:HAMP domain-containing sensor histidine kinase [Paenibacillus sp. FA6]|uniref:HAMP domain-containing sensor histidine kinase n=1 Tax=Paenibacillus sp. FA6 TaxID=3413029 RepID=UPI003F660339